MSEKTYTLKELRELPVGTQVLAETEKHGPLWVTLGHFWAAGMYADEAVLKFYETNGLNIAMLTYREYGETWVAYKEASH